LHPGIAGRRRSKWAYVKPPATTSTTAETAEYIGGIARELRAIATRAELGFLAYLLSMVEHEAAETVTRSQRGQRRAPAADDPA